jgi:hypothetical protein
MLRPVCHEALPLASAVTVVSDPLGQPKHKPEDNKVIS